jgi:phosphoribosylaminoimidazolecarboxamide formyltransferase/IMP cyclohydrolase
MTASEEETHHTQQGVSMPKIRRALLSVSDKTGIVEFAAALSRSGVEILSTGGTAAAIGAAGTPVVQVSDFTGQPEILGGRVKTLTPRIHGGILGRRKSAAHRREMKEHGILPIDLVAVNLYPFEATITRPGSTFADAIENIDIGGPAMPPSAAKNFEDVTVVVDPKDYPAIVEEMKRARGSVSKGTRVFLARKAFAHTAYYDGVIRSYLAERVAGSPFPEAMSLPLAKAQNLRYGENPHQRAALYREPGVPRGVAGARQLGGKELSFNNYLDLEAAWAVARDFPDRPFVAIVKHNNPCGAGAHSGLVRAFGLALATDPLSAFGGVVGVSQKVTAALAARMAKIFFEAVIAPGYTKKAVDILKTKKNLRILDVSGCSDELSLDVKKIAGGYVVQDPDTVQIRNVRKLPVATRRRPTAAEYRALDFAWKMVRHVKSNAIIFTRESQLIGVGAGQMSRVDSCRIAAMKANSPLEGTVAASDAFFPFRDGIDQIAEAGATAVIQPGGSIRDREVVEAANEHGLAMILTGHRHFKH